MSVDNSIVTLDDTDPQLQWSGPWFTTANNLDDPDNLGPPFLGTLHGISGNGSVVFSFYGKIVGIWGSLKPRNTSLGPDPNWQCVLDGQDIGQISGYPDQAASNYKLCGAGPLPEGYHTLQLNTVIQSEPLNVDQVQYQAAATANIGDAWTQVDQRDGRFNYSLGWEQDGLLRWTYTSGAWLTFDFVGTGVIWGGYTPDNPGVGSGLAQYLVDSQVTPTTFDIPSRPGSFINQPYFNISGLSPGPHRLQVRNAGNANTAALGLTYVYLKNSLANTPTPKRNTGKVIGGAVGGTISAIFLLLLVIAILVWRRRRRNQQQTQESASVGGTSQGKRMSMMSGSTTLKEQVTPGSLTQGTFGIYPNMGAHIPPVVPSTGALGPTTFVTPYGSYQPTTARFDPPSPYGANQPVTFATPSGPTTSVNPYSSYQPASGPPGANQTTTFVTPTRPTTFVTPSRGPHRAPLFNSASSSPHLHASTSFPTLPAQPQVQQTVWPAPRQTPVQHSQDGRPDEADFDPYR